MGGQWGGLGERVGVWRVCIASSKQRDTARHDTMRHDVTGCDATTSAICSALLYYWLYKSSRTQAGTIAGLKKPVVFGNLSPKQPAWYLKTNGWVDGWMDGWMD